jgi:hypothetical protein
VFWFRAVRALGEVATSLANKLRISRPAVSRSVRRGEEIVKEMGFGLLPEEWTYEIMDAVPLELLRRSGYNPINVLVS